jgi:ATP-dependent helicase/nuclease subunit A
VLVAAAAGSGKTAVLVERVKNMVIDEGVPLSEILVVTFTEAAAAEMKQKIEKSLNDVLNYEEMWIPNQVRDDSFSQGVDASDAKSVARWQEVAREQLQQISSANISTFHGFAMSVIKKYFYTIGLDPSFKVVPTPRNILLREEAMDELFAEKFEAEDADFIRFLQNYSSAKNEKIARDMIEKVYDFIMNLPRPFEWLDESVQKLYADTSEFKNSEAFKYSFYEITVRLDLVTKKLKALGDFIEENGFPFIWEKNNQDRQVVSNLLEMAESFWAEKPESVHESDDMGVDLDDYTLDFADAEMEEFRAAFRGIKSRFATFAAKKSEKESGWDDVKEAVKARRDAVKAELESLEKKFFQKSLDTYVTEIRETAESAEVLKNLVLRYHEIFSEKKRTLGFIDFSDMEHFALEILAAEKVSEEYKENFKYIFIDEYQDSNYLQETIIQRVSSGSNVYMVGDVKQSIYRFRKAEPDLFLEKYGSFPKGEGQGNLRIDLNRNFRSKAGILNAVNALFERLMTEHYSNMTYDEDAKLNLGLNPPEDNEAAGEHWNAKPEIWIVSPAASESPQPDMNGNEENPESKTAEDRAVDCEALMAAEIIKGLVGTMRFDAKEGKEVPITHRDIVILLRKDGKDGENVQQTLEAEGIPAFTEKGKGFFDTVEIETFLKLLAVIDNFRQDVPLAAAMYSVVFGFTTEEMATVRIQRKDGNFYQAVFAYAEDGGDDELRQKCRLLGDRIEAWRSDERFMRLDEFIWRLMNESGLYSYAGALSNGAQRQANLKALLKFAADFQNDRLRGLGSFLSYMEAIKKRVETPQVSMTGEGDDAVKIMSIHKSKGLEFPVVILCQMDEKLGGGWPNNKVMLHKDIGIALEWQSYELRAFKSTLLHTKIRQRNEIEDQAEYIRLLYVAMTRPMDRLFMIGTKKDPVAYVDEVKAFPLGKDEKVDIMGADNFLDLIMPVAVTMPAFVVKAIENLQTDHPVSFAATTWVPIRSTPPPEGNEGRREGTADLSPLLASRFDWVYPFASEEGVKAKYSVTSLLKRDGTSRADHPVSFAATTWVPMRSTPPSEGNAGVHFFMEGSSEEGFEDAGLSAAERGTVFHKVLELLDFREAYENRGDLTFFEAFVAGLSGVRAGARADHPVSFAATPPREGNLVGVDLRQLLLFSGSQICEWASEAIQVKKEIPFNMKMNYEGNEIVVQGIVDCLIITGKEAFIIDYKTGYFNAGDWAEEERIIDKYGEQVEIYAEAMAAVLGRRIDAGFIYMTRTGTLIKVCTSTE